MDLKGKRKIRTLFIALCLFLPLQYGLVGIIGELHSEPWPAFVFPGFKNVYSTGSGIEIEQHYFRIYRADRESVTEVRPQDLFPELPLSQIPGFMRTHFHDSVSINTFSDEAVIWLYNLAEELRDEKAEHMEIVIRKNNYLTSEGAIIFDSILSEEFIPIPKRNHE